MNENVSAQTQGQPLVAINPQGNPAQDIQDKFFDFQQSRVHLQRLIDDWHGEIDETDQRRKERKVEIDVENLRQKNELDEDETLIPIRIIDTNITREQPPFINYLKNSRRIAIFESLDDPDLDTDLIEQEFTKKATYCGWEVPFFKCLDGAQLHGWDAVEVVEDQDKPGNFAIEQIGHDKLFFPRSCLDIQSAPRVARGYDVTISQLQDWVQLYGFSQEQVDLIVAANKDTRKEAETTRVYKLYFKRGGIVYVSWFCLTHGAKDWLKNPVQHYVGIDEQTQGGFVPKPLTVYPIFLLPYKLDEQSKIIDARGRGFLDCYKQEAMTALWSAFINGMNRASGIYGSPKQEDGTGASLKEIENLKLNPGRILNKPIEFWHPDYPDPLVLKTLQFADVQNSDENNQVNFAAINREDSRKTAKEIGAAQQQQSLLNSVQLTLFSTFIRQVYSFVWLIVQSQALQNKIQFLLIKQQIPMLHPQLNVAIPGKFQTVFVNNIEVIGQRFDIRAAGDVDVIAKQEMLQKMQQDWPVISQTALRDVFLMDYVRLAYPERAQQYVLALQQGSQMGMMKSMIGQLSTTLEGALKDAPEAINNLSQQEKSDLSTMMMQAKQMAGIPQQMETQQQ